MGHMQEKIQVGDASDWYHGSMYNTVCVIVYLLSQVVHRVTIVSACLAHEFSCAEPSPYTN